ncbi:MAG TPA: 16S rRNA (uracil(1498)-N(3))-methyltransferase [Opitutaceae bacterium]|nr:16S rRNA (uracil(1498)-N(3))-methyltransferase [Opitutaceae bacterium]
MPDFRVFCTPPTHEPAEILLEETEAHHLVSVNRARVGDTVVAFDGAGHEWICELAAIGKRDARLKVRFPQKIKALPYAVTLGQALPKGKYMDAIVRKATEIGVAGIVPLVSERTEVQLESDREENKLEKWRAAAIEAAKQCGNAFLPAIQPVQRATDFMESTKGFDLKLIASLQPGAKSLKTVLARFREEKGQAPRKVLWLVGPEGDFTPAEMSISKNAGFEPITLGPLVLRCETAAVYALSILSYELQNT